MPPVSSRPVYRREQTRRLIAPASIAIVGASANPASFGARTLGNLHSFGGPIHLINGKYKEIDGRACHASLSDLPEVPDCAFVAVPRDGVKAVVEECVRLGVGGVVIFASGLGESSNPAHQALQRDIVELTRHTGTRLLGPNCLGMMNAVNGALGTFTHIPVRLRIEGCRSIGLISQSGALGVGMAQAVERGVSFSHVLTSGNGCDVDAADQIAYLAEDPDCDAIACVFEGVTDPGRLIEAGEIARRAGKAVVVYKIGTSESGAEAALSHTGALAGSAAGYNALFERAGFVVVDQYEHLLEAAAFFAKAPPAKADGVAVLTPSGGAGIMAADQAEVFGVELPQPGPALRAVLESHIPEFGSSRNPCDVTAQILNNPASFPACAEAFLQEAHIGAIVTPYTTAIQASAQRNIDLGRQVRAHGKMACIFELTGWMEGPGVRDMEMSPDLAVFRSTASCFRTLSAWHQWSRRQAQPADAGEPPALTPAQRQGVEAALQAAGAERTLPEGPSRRVLEACGVPVVNNQLVNSAEGAVAAAGVLGYPVALKVETPDLPHKTDAGVLRLNLKDEAAVREAYAAIMANALKATTAERINGVLVQPMIPPGVEIMVGARVDPLFGPMVVVGMGGILVELLKDTAAALAPVSPAAAHELLRRLRGYRLLQGFRGSAPADVEALAEAVSRISLLIHGERERIAEIDVNPIICGATRVVAVDGLVVRA
ncbi:acetate--CoA ligase family protein [Hydrogenophaga sp.]|uniref:acetate--CoA ligase family protein n=1 Tax=Hydrogenophaga sp. TaxID=1904254 RepID=UPI00262433D1|nr:acetate--CoA ligase family protein [Hydrogenophaga sp.]MCW5654743.1 acetate--CoA ligase family protein [Hydrogenophaga sp.]